MAQVGTAGSFRQAGYERAKGDLYETPSWCVGALLDHVDLRGPIREPHCGMGAIASELIKNGHVVVASDLYDWEPVFGDPLNTALIDCEKGVDFLKETDLRGCINVVMNPPYGKEAEKHVIHAIRLIPPNGVVCALLRWNWMAAKGRGFLWQYIEKAIILGRVNMPPTGAPDKGHTATTDYAWFVFWKWPAFANIKIIRA